MTRTYSLSDEGRAARAEQKMRSRAALLDAARTLFAEKGYDGVSVSEIGRRAGVSHTLINGYFNGKAGLLYELVEANNSPQLVRTAEIAQGEGTPLDRLWRVLTYWAESDLADPRVLQVLQSYSWVWGEEQERRNRASRDAFRAHLIALIDEARASGHIPETHSADMQARAMFALYTWGMREAVFRSLQPDAAIERLWPFVEAQLGVQPK
ncbi:TetR family transcriptional regulator [Palleronia aestuarii]|uniref:TetR family transcriptional regulator n=1 Tax=Palleronia aestuarii TaxID=568105 RepID=A0A2W7NDZ0_9RHOB|nr:TetR/AcrR family transcriptional regulator [Palleronia aestuarii]PZX11316.1 TetR family transcriptional regulator [Palleronia aestuarii]